MYELKKKYWKDTRRVNLFGPRPHLMKKNLPGRCLTKFEKHWPKRLLLHIHPIHIYHILSFSTARLL